MITDQIVCFAYEHRYRLVLVQRVWQSLAGHILITGLDEDRNDFRTFRVDRIKGRVRIVGQQQSGPAEALAVPPRDG